MRTVITPMLNTVQAAGAAEAVPAVGAAWVTAVGAARATAVGAARATAVGAVWATAVGAAWATVVGAARAIAVGAVGTEACSFFIKKKTSPCLFCRRGLLLHKGQTKLHIMVCLVFKTWKEEEHDTPDCFRSPESKPGYMVSS